MSTKLKLPKLPKAFKKKWVAALRSKKYQQGRLYLRDEGISYCCLGVACRVAGISGEEIKLIGTIPKRFKTRGIPEMLCGVPGDNPLVKKLTSFNDGNLEDSKPSRSFNWIASYIERYL